MSKHSKGAFHARKTLQKIGYSVLVDTGALFRTSASPIVERNLLRMLRYNLERT